MTETEQERLDRLSRDKFVRQLPKRFYKEVTLGPDHEILLDGRAVKTPLKAVLRLPTMELAQAVAAEWQAQATEINPHSMPLTKLANTAIDRAGPHLEHIRSDIVSYAANDLVCYRVSGPQELAARQTALWDPVLTWAERRLGARFVVTDSLIHIEQPEPALAAVANRVEEIGPFGLVAIHTMTTLSGSALLGLMTAEGAVDAPRAWDAATVEEQFQAEQWGRDPEAEARNAGRAAEFTHCALFINLAGQDR